MKLKFFAIPSVLLIAITLIISSCAKDGSAGATGPAGPAGPQGPGGAPGVPGAAGPAGTANVIYSAWTDTTTWRPDTTMTGTKIDTVGWFANISAPKLDTTMLNTGEIKVYINLGTTADPVVFPLPFNNGRVFIDVVFFTNTIQVSSNANLKGLPIRYILIPGGVKAGRGYKTINWNDYNQVKAFLNLKD